jgi:hypothetical protein
LIQGKKVLNQPVTDSSIFYEPEKEIGQTFCPMSGTLRHDGQQQAWK